MTATTDETTDGLFSMEDDYGMSYYYRGDVEDNYVKFGAWANTTDNGDKAGKPMYWRIIRVNGDGSIRMIYDGTSAHINGESSADRVAQKSVVWNTTNNKDAKYVGYMYGGANGTASIKRINLGEEGYADSTNAIYNQTDSNMKTQLESWYRTNLSENDDNVADVIYCNDRSISENSQEWWKKESTDRGFGQNYTAYGGWGRFLTTDINQTWNTTNPSPNLKCKDKNDSFTKEENDKGNGLLKEKVGLITVDEVSIAGGIGRQSDGSSNNNSFYLYKGVLYWTLSPLSYHYSLTNGVTQHYAYLFMLSSHSITSSAVHINGISMVPVISLTPEYFATLIGDGAIGNPYREKGMEP